MYKKYVKRLNPVDVSYGGVCWFLVCYSGVCLVVLKGDDGSVMVFFGWAESFLTLIEIFLYSFIIN